ncbi:MAG TPA: histidine phosphatase family protein [Chloroflexota bacterium]|jgi:broad specificity phosphatase PhoE|nr:histidine phosphatase family protein [Chloroflexota bacterium]
MHVYFVRHAESQYNALDRHQVASIGLSELGIKQAEDVGQRLSTKKIDVIMSSPYERARQTAEFVSAAVQKPVELNALLTEIKRPSVIEGRQHDDPEAVRIRRTILDNFHDPAWRYADEETFFDVKDRAVRCIEFITCLDKGNVLLVTHGGTMGMIIAVMLHGKELEVRDFLKLQDFLHADNASITLCDYTNGKTWKLITWNDCAHLECLADFSPMRNKTQWHL